MGKSKSKTNRSHQLGFSKRSWLIFSICVSFVILSGLAWYATSALLKDEDRKLNQFRVGNVQAQIKETFEPPAQTTPGSEAEAIQKQVEVENTGEQTIFVRVMLLPQMEKTTEEGSTISLPASFTGASPQLGMVLNTTDWIQGEDGYFYYLHALKQGTKTHPVLEKVYLIEANLPEELLEEYQEAQLRIDVKTEVVNTTKGGYPAAFWQNQEPVEPNLKKVSEAYHTQTNDSE